jgi:Big-like domain-containing protein
MKTFIQTAIAALALTAAAFAGVTVTSPSNGSTVTSPAHFVASASSGAPITTMRIYVDGVSAYTVSGAKIDTSVSMAAGTHNVVVQAWDSTGAVFKAPLTVSVSGTTTTATKTFSNIDQMPSWDQCDVCSGPGANGAVTPHSMTENVASPSMDGKSAQFWIGGTSPYASAIWWKQLGANTSVKHFKYDLYFYLKDSNAPEALEFDTNQSMGGYRYVFGTECSLKTSHMWSVWDGGGKHWVATSAPCNYIAPYTWHHLVEEYERSATGQVRIITITLDGTKYYINKYMPAQKISSTAQDINVAIQLDGNSTMTDYAVWADKITLSYY